MFEESIYTAVVDLMKVRPHDENYNRHSPEQVEKLRQSLKTFGYVRRGVMQDVGNGRFVWVAGHGVGEAALAEGFTELEVTIIPQDWTAAKVLAYLVADNELAKQAEVDDGRLAALLTQVRKYEPEMVSATGLDDKAVQDIIDRAMLAEQGQGDAPAQVDKASELQERWGTALGQVWRLPSRDGRGEHRIVCGDCMNTAVSGRVLSNDDTFFLLADTPYGKLKIFNNDGAVGYAGSNLVQVKHYGVYEGHADFDLSLFLELIDWDKAIIWGGNNFTDFLPITQSWLVWDKRAGERTLFYAECEMAWSNLGMTARMFNFTWQGMIRQGEKIERVHPTQKPVELYDWCLGFVDESFSIIFDPTLGSGGSLVACENNGRYLRGIEIMPKYVAVCLQRYEDAFGITAELMDRGIGEPHTAVSSELTIAADIANNGDSPDGNDDGVISSDLTMGAPIANNGEAAAGGLL